MNDRPTVPASEPRWVPIRDAAVELGISWEAMRAKVKRRTIRSKKGNDRRVLVLMDGSPSDRPTAPQLPLGRPRTGPGTSHGTTAPGAPGEPMVPLALLTEAEARHRADLADAIAQERAETARRLAERDSLHLDTLGRLQAQAAAERSLLLARADAEIARTRVDRAWVLAVAVLALAEIVIVGRWITGG